jgi:hypothetical protein
MRGATAGWSDKGYVVFVQVFQFGTPAATAEWPYRDAAGLCR